MAAPTFPSHLSSHLVAIGATVCLLSGMGTNVKAVENPGLRVYPSQVQLNSPESSSQVLVFGRSSDGNSVDVTRQATFQVSEADIIQISSMGRVIPLKEGRVEVSVNWNGNSSTVAVEVKGIASPPAVSFHHDVIPILSKAGCNSGGCHGKAEGQNGFKLSVFGYDPPADYEALVNSGRGRRVFPSAPENSLLVRKATAEAPHGGGRKIEPDSRWDRLLQRWIREGMSLDPPSIKPLSGIVVEPSEVTLEELGTQQLRVSAIDANGTLRCVTSEADFQSNNEAIAGVDRQGLIAATAVPGEAAILVRYLGHVGVCRVTRPNGSGSSDLSRQSESNFIDRLVWDKLDRLHLIPSSVADDASFMRRAFVDTIGTLPTTNEARGFLADQSTGKRSRLVAELLQRPEYSDYWAQRWSDLLRIDKDTITPQSAVAMSRWVRDQIDHNVPYDQFVRSILTAQGSTLSQSPAAFFQVHSEPEKAARAVSQLFLGVRIECAQCHHHPFERWDQKDYFALAGFFTDIKRSPHPLGGLKIAAGAGSDVIHPRTTQPVPAAGLGAPPATFAMGQDRRQVFAQWATSPENPYFTRTIVNRVWAHYFGRGLVEPIDDLRATNPASNERLLDALAQHLIELRFDLKSFTQSLLDSQVYQLSSEVNESNRIDEQNYSHALWKPLPAEVLLDAISQATGIAEEFNGWPKGYRAIQVWDNKLPSHFLEVFGRPRRETVCACERGTEPSIAQALHLMNAPGTIAKIHEPSGRAAQLAQSELTPDAIIEELYLATLSRFPNQGEQQLMRQAFAESQDRPAATEDILWTLLNTKEFVFNH